MRHEALDKARSELAHALCTLGVDVAWQGELDQGLALLKMSAGVARRAGRLDDHARLPSGGRLEHAQARERRTDRREAIAGRAEVTS